MSNISPLFLVLVLLVTGARLSALEYKEVIGSYGIDFDATIALIKAKITPENEKQMQEMLKDLEREKDKVQLVTFTFNAKTIEFMMDDGTGQVDKNVNEITSITPAADASLAVVTHSTTNPSASGHDDETTLTLSRRGAALVMEATGMSVALKKK